jgi:hypothetical protein
MKSGVYDISQLSGLEIGFYWRFLGFFYRLDIRLKPRLYEALKNAGAKDLPKSWAKSIYHQAFEASMESPKRKRRK